MDASRVREVLEGLCLQVEHAGVKDEIAEVIAALVGGKHAFALYPTGFGKSDCFAFVPPIMDKLHPPKHHIALIVSPLRSLMMDQVRRWNRVGIPSAAILAHKDMDEQTILGIKAGEFSLVFASPEAALAPEWYQMFIHQAENICLFALDEVHCMIKWNFRTQYARVSRLRSPLSAVPVLCLTATATPQMVDDILKELHIGRGDVLLKGKLPDRPNIHLDKKRVSSASSRVRLSWVVDLLREHGQQCPKIIIYTRTVQECALLWGTLCGALKEDLHVCAAPGDRSVHNRLVDMFHGQSDSSDQERVLEAFTRDGPLRCVTSTSAFGLGVQVDSVRHIIHWGPANDLLEYWQQVGRAGRDGQPSHAVMYLYPYSVNKAHIKTDMLQFVDADSKCLREKVLENLWVPGMDKGGLDIERQNCCSVCDSASHAE